MLHSGEKDKYVKDLYMERQAKNPVDKSVFKGHVAGNENYK